MAHTQIAAFARLATENTLPKRVLAGQKTLLARDVHDIRYDSVHDEIFVTNSSAQAILAFRGGADGEEAPIRIIQGPRTQLVGTGSGSLLDRLEVDEVHNEIFIPSEDSVLVFPREANGDVAPLRVIRGADTQLSGVTAIAVDPLNNLIAVATAVSPWERVAGGRASPRFVQNSGLGSIVIFNRTDNGNVRPRAVIEGPNTGIERINQMQVYSPKGWIIAAHPGTVGVYRPDNAFVGVWSIHDTGDVPPRWKLGGPQSTLAKPRGVALAPEHKEVFVADMRLNAVLTYYFPEIF